MALFNLEHGTLAYRADFALYGAAVLGLAVFLATAGPHQERLGIAGWLSGGLLGWTLVEYLLHRFVLHGVQPFRRWHTAHHDRPTALICAPTLLSAALIVMLVFVPAWLLAGPWTACALTLGVLVGYFGYAITHHATHHWRADTAWLMKRKRWHAAHHHHRKPGCFGVTSGFWDRVFGTTPGGREVLPTPTPAAQGVVRAPAPGSS